MLKRFFTPGTSSALISYFLWGIVPIYWKQLHHIDPIEILSHRSLWAFVFYFALCLRFNTLQEIFKQIFNSKTLQTSLWCALMLSINWGLFIYAVNSQQILEASLGYFLNPLLNILVGIIFLKEQTTIFTKYGFILAAIGTLILSIGVGKIPWIAIALAVSFSFYGLLRKKQKGSVWLSSLSETFYLIPFSMLYLIYQGKANALQFYPHRDIFLLVLSGVVTGLPLLFFANAAQKMPFSRLGFFQYISPTLQLLCGVLIYKEPTSVYHKISFFFVWLALLVVGFGPIFKTKKSIGSPT